MKEDLVLKLKDEIRRERQRNTDLDEELDAEQCQNDTYRDELVELEGLREERDMLAYENKQMAEYLLYLHECNKIDLEITTIQ